MPARGRIAWLRERGMGASILVAALSSAFGVVLLATTTFLGAVLRADPYLAGSGTLEVVVLILAVLLLGVAVYVALRSRTSECTPRCSGWSSSHQSSSRDSAHSDSWPISAPMNSSCLPGWAHMKAR